MPEGYTGVSLIAHTGAAERIVLPVVAVLGVTTATSLQHTSNLFDSLTPSANEVASIALAERASVAPILANDVASDLADTYKLATTDLGQLFSDAVSARVQYSSGVRAERILRECSQS